MSLRRLRRLTSLWRRPCGHRPKYAGPVTLTATRPPAECDVIVVGGGILGLAAARELLVRRPGARLAVLEREAALATHQTGRTSGVVHAGIYYQPGSLKARLCVEGARQLRTHCEERAIPFEANGKLIVAAEESELPRLDELARRGRENGVAGLRRVSAEEMAAIEPHARGLAALHSPATAVVDFTAVAHSFAADVSAAGGTVHTDCAVLGIKEGRGRIALRHSRGITEAGAAVFCAGLWADRLAVAAGAPADPRIVPFRGTYMRLRPQRRDLVRANVYPVPDPELPFLGAHLTRGVDGEVLLGPSALIAPARDGYRPWHARPRDLASIAAWPGTWRLAARHWRAGLGELRRAASRRSFVADAARLVPKLRLADVEPGPVGIRAQALGRDGRLVDDFVVHATERAVHVRNAPSPAATSSLPIAKLIADRVEELD
jgi:(S)-2-hydroxyglutarate dehydrogenase